MKSEHVTRAWECYRDYNYASYREPMRNQFRELDDYVYGLETENAKLRELVAHLMYVKPNDVNAILHKGKLLRFDYLLAEVGMRWKSEVE